MLDLTEMNAIVHFDAETGLMVAQAGVTIEQIWRYSLPKAYWPPVVPGTMYPTLGGLLAMNIHGKNNWKYGTIGEHVVSFRMMTVDGEILTCSREENPELFHAAIGSFGMLGCFIEVSIKLKKIHSGLLDVTALPVSDLGQMISWLDTHRDDYDYLVGWVDCFAAGPKLGRGLIHAASYLAEGEDSNPEASLKRSAQDLPKDLFFVIPKAWLWRGLKFFMNDFGMRLVNFAKFQMGCLGRTRDKRTRQAHAAFNFLLDYVPDWKKAYLPGGLIQYQSFVPKENAREMHSHLIQLCHRSNLVPYLGVYKRHKPDPFLLTHAVDGFSLAMDFKVTERNRDRLWDLAHRMDELVLEAGGRFYFAKDSSMLATTAHRIWPAESLALFRSLKERYDPDDILQTSLSRRLFPEWTAAPAEIIEGEDRAQQS